MSCFWWDMLYQVFEKNLCGIENYDSKYDKMLKEGRRRSLPEFAAWQPAAFAFSLV